MNIKYKVIQIILLENIKEMYKGNKFIRIDLDFKLEDNLKCSILFEDLKDKKRIAYIITDKDENYLQIFNESNKQLIEYGLIKESKLIIIPIKTLSNDINELNKELDKFII
jgi:hypothetical protein